MDRNPFKIVEITLRHTSGLYLFGNNLVIPIICAGCPHGVGCILRTVNITGDLLHVRTIVRPLTYHFKS